jgi:hypothetical protein
LLACWGWKGEIAGLFARRRNDHPFSSLNIKDEADEQRACVDLVAMSDFDESVNASSCLQIPHSINQRTIRHTMHRLHVLEFEDDQLSFPCYSIAFRADHHPPLFSPARQSTAFSPVVSLSAVKERALCVCVRVCALETRDDDPGPRERERVVSMSSVRSH